MNLNLTWLLGEDKTILEKYPSLELPLHFFVRFGNVLFIISILVFGVGTSIIGLTSSNTISTRDGFVWGGVMMFFISLSTIVIRFRGVEKVQLRYLQILQSLCIIGFSVGIAAAVAQGLQASVVSGITGCTSVTDADVFQTWGSTYLNDDVVPPPALATLQGESTASNNTALGATSYGNGLYNQIVSARCAHQSYGFYGLPNQAPSNWDSSTCFCAGPSIPCAVIQLSNFANHHQVNCSVFLQKYPGLNITNVILITFGTIIMMIQCALLFYMNSVATLPLMNGIDLITTDSSGTTSKSGSLSKKQASDDDHRI